MFIQQEHCTIHLLHQISKKLISITSGAQVDEVKDHSQLW